MRTLLQIGEIAQLLGVTPKTIRHYEKIGLLARPERTRAGYRLYDAQDLLRLQRIRRLQALGLSLKKIRALPGQNALLPLPPRPKTPRRYNSL
jgi:DNA-binding transcriptional MerR regulator